MNKINSTIQPLVRRTYIHTHRQTAFRKPHFRIQSWWKRVNRPKSRDRFFSRSQYFVILHASYMRNNVQCLCADFFFFSRMTNLDYVTSKIKSAVIQQTIAGYWIPNNNKICLTDKVGFDKINISGLGPWCVYRYFSEDTTYAVLCREMVSINTEI
jgi:hypothetical protein